MDGVLERKELDLDIICPRKIRNRIADEIIDEWDLVGRELDVSDKKLKSIREDCALTLPERKAVAVLDAWAEEHGRGATCLKLAEALNHRKKIRVIEILYDEVTQSQMKRDTTMSGADVAVSPRPSYKQQQEQGHYIIEPDVEVVTRIKELDPQFRLLHEKIESELELKKVTVRKLIRSLSLLPYDIEQEYKQTITEKLPDLRKQEEVNDIFCLYINPLVSFMDYGLTKHIIDQYGSDTLKKEMNDYSEDVVRFMKKTTVTKMIDHWPGPQEIHPNYSVLMVTINENPNAYTLYHIDQLRKQYCSELKMSTLSFKTIGLKMSNSFIVEWLVPSALVPQLMESARQMDLGFYLRECILKVVVGEKQIFPILPDSKPKDPALQTTAAMVTPQPAVDHTTQRGCYPDWMAAQPSSRVVRYGPQISAILKGKLRDCQILALVSLVKWIQNPETTNETAIVVMPTGSGKSGVIASLPYWFGDAVVKGELSDIDLDKPILVIAPGLDILKQLKHCLKQEVGKPCFLIKVEAIKDTRKECRDILYSVKVTEKTSDVPNLRYCQDDIVLINAQKWKSTPTDTEVLGATWQDLDNDLFSLVVVDEAHHLPATQWKQIIDKFQPYAKVIFFTATPYRADGKKIDDIVPKYAYHLSDREATDLRIIRRVKFKELPYREDDNRQASYAKKLEYRPYIERVIEEVINCIKHKAPLPEGVPHCAMLICRDIAETKDVMMLCREKDPGMRVECVHSQMKKGNLDRIMKEIDQKLIRIIVIVQKLLEGFDCPCVSVAGILTRIRSAPKFAQFIGRARRVIHGEGNVVADVITHEYFEQDKLYRKYIDGHLIPVNDDDVDSN